MLSVRSLALLAGGAMVFPVAATLLGATAGHAAVTPFTPARAASPVILTGAQLGAWSQLPATGVGNAYPSGSAQSGDSLRSAHNGRLFVPPGDGRTGIDPDKLAAYKFVNGGWLEVPIQVDQKFPYFLANGHSSFSTYSATDQELTYAWAPDRHSTGEEAWKKVFGDCSARYATPTEQAGLPAVGTVPFPPSKPFNATQPPPGSLDPGYTTAMQDPVPQLDDDDEVSFLARDAGDKAPTGAPQPSGTLLSTASGTPAQSVQVVDPLDPQAQRFVYLFLKAGGSSFTAATNPVQMTRDANADEYIDRYSFAAAGNTVKDPETLGTSNTGYGPNQTGSVCRTAQPNDGGIVAADGVSRASTDRFPRDGMTVTTPTYRLKASGRWMVRDLQVARPGAQGIYGPDLVSRWKGRAFQQSPDSSISLVGFEDEQVNWEANSALLGWRQGPVRAIREIWGADSGTNVTKVETYYRDADSYAYHVRVHPIPPDGLYTSWDYNPGAVSTYYNTVKSGGVPIDGVNDDTGQVDTLPGTGLPCPYASYQSPGLPIPLAGGSRSAPCPGAPAYFDGPDPTYDLPSAVYRPEEVAGPNGGLVYEFEFTSPTFALNPLAVPYYRDDACVDDGTGDAPVPRPWPGEASYDDRVKAGYVAYWQQYWDSHPEWQSIPRPTAWTDLFCDNGDPNRPPPNDAAPWHHKPFAAAFGQHGIHFFTTHDSDNAFTQANADEIVGQQWRFSVPMDSPVNVAQEYGANVSAKLVGFAAPYTPGAATATAPPSPSPSASVSPTASPTGTASPSPTPSGTASPTATPTATDTPTGQPTTTNAPRLIPLIVTTDRTEIVPTQAVSVTVHGSPNEHVQLLAYSRPSSTYRVARDSRTDTNGNVSFSVTPGGNTRMFATYGNGDTSTDSESHVIQVHTTLSLSAIRTAVRTYDFHGRNLPRRPGQLITLYRVDNNGAEIRTAVVRTDDTGTWQLSRAFAGPGTFTFLVRTSTYMDNANGRSNNVVVAIH